MQSPRLPAAAVELVPHRSPMLFVDELLDYQDDSGVVSARIAESNPFLRPDGTLDPLAAIELLAQAAAAHDGYGRLLRGEGPASGLLVGIRDVSATAEIRCGDFVRVAVERGAEFEALKIVRGTLAVRDEPVASGEIKIFVGDAEPSGGPPVRSSPSEDPAIEGEAATVAAVHPLYPRWGRLLGMDPIRAVYLLDRSFPAFRGHFSGNPILPAVALAALCVEAVTTAEGPGTRLLAVRSAKFRRVVLPGEQLHVTCTPSAGGVSPGWSARVESGGHLAATVAFDVSRDRCG